MERPTQKGWYQGRRVGTAGRTGLGLVREPEPGSGTSTFVHLHKAQRYECENLDSYNRHGASWRGTGSDSPVLDFASVREEGVRASSCLLGQAASSQRPAASPLAGDVVQVLMLCPHTRQHSVLNVTQASPAWPPRPPGEPCECS